MEVFKYKFAKMKRPYHSAPVLVVDYIYETVEDGSEFICWLTDEITVEYPED